MRTFKITVITIVLFLLAAAALWALRSALPGMGPSQSEFEDVYDEDGVGTHDQEGVYDTQLKQYEGIVKILGVSLYDEATHRLEQDDQLIVLLNSTSIVLADYLDQEVRVQGIVRDTSRGDQKVMEVLTIDVLNEAEAKTFSEQGFEMSFEYPSAWQVFAWSDVVTFNISRDGREVKLITIEQFLKESTPLDVWLEDRDQNLIYSESQVSVASHTGVRRVIQDNEDEIIKTYVKIGNNVYEIRLIDQDPDTKQAYFDILDGFTGMSASDEVSDEMAAEDSGMSDDMDSDQLGQGEENEDVLPDEGAAETSDELGTSDQQEESSGEQSSSTDSADEVENLSPLEPLSADEIQRTIDKGISSFQGRQLSFQYPTIWYFSYLEEGYYGFTDHETYVDQGEQVNRSNSRVFLLVDAPASSCVYNKETTVLGKTYTVCALQSGLNSIVDKIAESIN